MRIKTLGPQINACERAACPTGPVLIFYVTHLAPVGIGLVIPYLNKYLDIISCGINKETDALTGVAWLVGHNPAK